MEVMLFHLSSPSVQLRCKHKNLFAEVLKSIGVDRHIGKGFAVT